MQNVFSYTDLIQKMEGQDRVALLIHNPENESSRCAFRSITEATYLSQTTLVCVADVTQVRDIHTVYEITTVPSLLLFVNGKLANVVKGCHESIYFKAVIGNELSETTSEMSTKKTMQVIVYSTPTCSWCNTLKSWLRKNNIQFTDIDVSANEKAAQDLVRRSGQQGVPQTEINGQIVIGFDQQRLKQLLEIQ